MKDLKVEVNEVRKQCGARHKKGDIFYVRGKGTIEIPDGKRICLYALNSLIPFLTAKQREEELPEDDFIFKTKHLCCPDSDGVVFKIKTI